MIYFNEEKSLKDEINELLIQYHETKDPKIREEIILTNKRLVGNVTKRYFNNYKQDMEDLFQAGMVGLIKATDTFDILNGKAQWATYAITCITNEINMYIRRKYKGEKKGFYNVSYDQPMNLEKNKGIKDLNLKDILIDENIDIENEIETNESYCEINEVIENTLSKRDLDIIKLRFGFYDGECKTQQEIADIYGISRSCVSRIEKRILKKLRKIFLKEE